MRRGNGIELEVGEIEGLRGRDVRTVRSDS